MSNDVPAGWYPTPDGKQRYWDGERWTNLPYEGAVEEAPAVVPTAALHASQTVPPAAQAPRTGPKRRTFVILGAAIALVVAVAVGGLAVKSNLDAQAEAAAAEAEAKEEAAADKKDQQERSERAAVVPQIETSVQTMAEGHAVDGVIDGPIISVSCSPVGGGSTDDLTERTTIFDCFVANLDNGDGTLSGYHYNATMNWDTGEYTYGLGKP